MVCGAATSRSSGGRSAVHTSSGTSAWLASTTAACSSTAAVPLVHSSTAGRPVARPRPSARNDAERSSWWTWSWSRGSDARASASGVEREPGATTASVTPARTHSSTSVAQKVAAMLTCLSWPRAPPHRATRRRPAAPRPGARLHPDRPLVVGRSPTTSHATTRWCWSTRRATAARRGPAATSRRARTPSARPAATRSTWGTPWAAASACSWPSTSPSGSSAWCCWARPRASTTPPNGPPARPPTRPSPPTSSATASRCSWSGGSPFLCSPGCPRTLPGSTTGGATPSAGLASSLRLAGTGHPGRPVGPRRAARRAGAGAGRRARREVRRPSGASWPRPSAGTPGSRPSPTPATPPTWSARTAFVRVLRRWLTERGW